MNRKMMAGTLVLIATAAAQEDLDRVPRVASISPAVGAENVPVGLRQIEVRFDTPMDPRGYSIVGGGPTFPEATGAPRWIDAYTCILPVRLKPNWEYSFSINSAEHNNFRSVRNVAAEPLACRFKTSAKGAEPSDIEAQRVINLESFDALCEAMRRGYSYLEFRGLDWERLFAEHRERVVASANTVEWTRLAAEMLREARDIHIHLEFDGTPYPTLKRESKPNFDWKGIATAMPGLVRRSENVATAMTDDGIGYLLIATWSGDAAGELHRVQEYLGEMSNAKAMVIDVRPNAGGSEALAKQVASWFVDERRVYARHVYRTGPGPDDFTPARERTIEPNELPRRFVGPTAVLMGNVNASSCESFLLMVRQVRRALLIGERSFGSSGNSKAVHLANGVKCFIPSWKDMSPEGVLIEGRGVSPDLEVGSSGIDWSNGDPIIERALQELRNGLQPPRFKG